MLETCLLPFAFMEHFIASLGANVFTHQTLAESLTELGDVSLGPSSESGLLHMEKLSWEREQQNVIFDEHACN